jgi:Holliday junction resolvase RusA-like endonuclease
MVTLFAPRPAVEFTVFGVPAPKGSKRGFPVRREGGAMGVAIVEGKTDRQKDWARRVEEVVQGLAQSGAEMLRGPLVASCVFYVPRPASAPKTRRTWPDKRPDLSKYLRAIEDPLSGVLFVDDAQIIEYVTLRKDFAEATPDPRPRCEYSLWRKDEYGE